MFPCVLLLPRLSVHSPPKLQNVSWWHKECRRPGSGLRVVHGAGQLAWGLRFPLSKEAVASCSSGIVCRMIRVMEHRNSLSVVDKYQQFKGHAALGIQSKG